jgi:hypothetical protein
MSETLTPQIINKLQAYLRKAFGSQTISVRAQPKKSDTADVLAGDMVFATLMVDDEDDELTYQLSWSIKDKPQPFTVQEMARIQTYMRTVLGAKTLSVRARGRLKDSVEVFVAEESLAILSAEKNSYEFQMAILEMDLDDIL